MKKASVNLRIRRGVAHLRYCPAASQALPWQCRIKPMKQVHGRESHRIEIKLRCYVTSPPVWAGGAMHIENIGRNGLLLVWHSQNGVPMPAVGQLITLEVELPADHGFGPKCIHCQGAITRISTEDGDSPRVAVSLNYMDFRPLTGRQGALEPISGKTISPLA